MEIRRPDFAPGRRKGVRMTIIYSTLATPMTPQAMRPPASPVGWAPVSALACTITERAMTAFFMPLSYVVDSFVYRSLWKRYEKSKAP